jgi:twitching motility protein PilT
MDVNRLIASIIQKNQGCSDLHFKVGRPPLYRFAGELHETEYPKLGANHTVAIAKALLPKRLQDEFESGKAVDSSYAIKGAARFRINVFHQRGSCEITMRVIPATIPKIEELGLPEILKKISLEERGLVLNTGPAGCGKSTTLAAMINYANENLRKHIITIEDPIEFVYTDLQSSVDQVEVGMDVPDFRRALRAALRQDPDIILVGEMRDIETIDTAIKAAETGHLVFSTLHTTDATKTITRIIDTFPPYQQQQVRYQLAAQLKAVVSQRLLPRADGTGLIPAVEVLISTVHIQDQIIHAEKTVQIRDTIARGRDHYGMQTVDQHLTDLYQADIITLEAALDAASNPSDFQRALTFE